MSRSYSTFREDRQPFTDGSKEPTYSATAPPDQVHHPFILDAEGRQMPIIRYDSGSNGETYVSKAEKIVEHITVPNPAASRVLVAEFRYGSEEPGKEDLFRDYGIENRYSHPGSTYHRTHLDSAYPEEVKEFITKVVTEAGRGATRPVAIPLTSAWHSGPNRIVQENTRKYDDERDFRGDDWKKPNGSPNRDRHYEPYLNNKGANTHPPIGNNRDVYDFSQRPRVNEGPNARNSPLSKPTNDIGTAMEFLKDATKPSYANANVQTEPSRRPIKTVPLAPAHWRTGSNMSGPETKMESKDYDSEKEEEEESRNHRLGPRDELKLVNNRGGAKPFQNKDGYEKPIAVRLGQTRFPGTSFQRKEQNTYPEKIDSKEARRRYGNLSSRAMAEEEHQGTISSRDAVQKYKGALV